MYIARLTNANRELINQLCMVTINPVKIIYGLEKEYGDNTVIDILSTICTRYNEINIDTVKRYYFDGDMELSIEKTGSIIE